MRATRLTGHLLWLLAAVAFAPVAQAGPTTGGLFLGCDFNGDGKGDVARNNGATGIRTDIVDNITSTANGNFANGGGVFIMKACGKFNNDAFYDIVAQGGGSIRVTFVGSTGTNTTGAPAAIFFGDGGGTWVVVDAQDVNGDGVDEIIAVNAAAGAVRMTDVSTGAATHTYLSTGGGIWGYMFGANVNGDTKRDLIFNGSGAALGVARGNLGGSAGPVLFYPQGGGAWVPTGAGHFDTSGRTGLVDTGAGAALGLYRVRLTDATGNVAGAAGFIANGSGSFGIRTIADMDNDGIQDLGEYSSAQNRVTKLNGIAVKGQYFAGNAGGSFQLRYAPDTNANQISSLVSADGSNNIRVQSTSGTAVLLTNVLAPAGTLVYPVY